MRQILFLLFVLSFSNISQAQELPFIEIGKRGNWLIDREVDPFKIGRLRYALNPFYFRTEEGQDWEKIGWQGKKILPYLEHDAEAMNEFKRYRRNRVVAFSTYGMSLATILGWSVRSMDNLFSGRRDSFAGILFTEPLAATLFSTSLTSTVISGFLSVASDRNLFNAVHRYNDNAGYANNPIQFKMSLALVSVQNQTAPGIGFRATW